MLINLKLRMRNFGFYRLHSSRRRVHEMIDVVGDDWEIHRDYNVPCRMVGLQTWKWSLANKMPSDVTLLEHI
ncbi:hypothetical protein TNCV_2058591 [Trichonephila clavipes]|nr:hypothetical protein TNCV_2058591 [Trichonephila clavipes]